MINFNFSLPTEVKFGQNAEMEVGTLLKKIGKRVLIHFGSDRIKENGLIGEIEGLLEKEGVHYVEFGGVQPNPSVDFVEKAKSVCVREGIDSILAIGGGSVVDSAKAIALGVRSDATIWDLYTGEAVMPEETLPIGVILTIPATGSEANGVSVLSNYKTLEKRMIYNPAIVPKFAILNPTLTISLSERNTAIAAADIFSHCFERYVDLRRSCIIWDSMCEATMRTVVEVSSMLMKEPQNYNLRSELMWSATVAHTDMLGPGGDFACHGLAHPLTALYEIPHGSAMAMIMLAWSRYKLLQYPERFQQFSQNVWHMSNGKEGISCMQEYFQKLGLPITFTDAGIENVDIDLLVKHAFSQNEDHLGGGLGLISPGDAERIYCSLKG